MKPCRSCGGTRRGAPTCGNKLGPCLDCKIKQNNAYVVTPEGRVAKARYNVGPKAKALQLVGDKKFKAERDGFRNLLLWSKGVRDFSQEYDFHHVVNRRVTGHDTIAHLLCNKSTWAQAWEEAHTLCVAWTREYHIGTFHPSHKMLPDGTYVPK